MSKWHNTENKSIFEKTFGGGGEFVDMVLEKIGMNVLINRCGIRGLFV